MVFWILLFHAHLTFPGHALYLSLIEIEMSENSATVLIKVFTDDLQNAIRNTNPDISLGTDESFPTRNADQISHYFKDHLVLETDRKLTLRHDSTEWIGDSYWLHFSTTGSQQQLKITADYLMEIFPTQQNIVLVSRDGTKRSCRLNAGSPSCEVVF